MTISAERIESLVAERDEVQAKVTAMIANYPTSSNGIRKLYGLNEYLKQLNSCINSL